MSIYMLSFPNNKHYIGQSIQSVDQRWIKHKSKAKNSPNEGCIALNAAINKYGSENIKVKTLLHCNNELLDYYEKKLIHLFDTLCPNGYNIMIGGNTNKEHSLSTKIKMKESALNRDSSIYRKTEDAKQYPKYVSRINTKYMNGYRISKHPNCSCKHFCDKSKTLDENFNDTLVFLNKLNNGFKVDNNRYLPQGLQKINKGYRVYVKIDNKLHIKMFTNQSTDIEVRRTLAIEYMIKNNLCDIHAVQRLNDSCDEN